MIFIYFSFSLFIYYLLSSLFFYVMKEGSLYDICFVFIVGFLLWEILLHLPPGSKKVESTFRLHFIHGVISTVFAGLYITGYYPDYYATMLTTSYFAVDLINMIVNDFYYKVCLYY